MSIKYELKEKYELYTFDDLVEKIHGSCVDNKELFEYNTGDSYDANLNAFMSILCRTKCKCIATFLTEDFTFFDKFYKVLDDAPENLVYCPISHLPIIYRNYDGAWVGIVKDESVGVLYCSVDNVPKVINNIEKLINNI